MRMSAEGHRKTPEELLRECQAEERAVTRKGYLKIFLGYASGVGKSFRMLDEARRRRERGQDVIVGVLDRGASGGHACSDQDHHHNLPPETVDMQLRKSFETLERQDQFITRPDRERWWLIAARGR